MFLMRNYNGAAPINVGIGEDLELRELAELVRRTVRYDGELRRDPSKPDWFVEHRAANLASR